MTIGRKVIEVYNKILTDDFEALSEDVNAYENSPHAYILHEAKINRQVGKESLSNKTATLTGVVYCANDDIRLGAKVKYDNQTFYVNSLLEISFRKFAITCEG